MVTDELLAANEKLYKLNQKLIGENKRLRSNLIAVRNSLENTKPKEIIKFIDSELTALSEVKK